MLHATIKRPILFSSYFKISSNKLDDMGLINPFLNIDTPLFIDPLLLEKSNNIIIKQSSIAKFKKHFLNLITLLSYSKQADDTAWKVAFNLLDLGEPPATGLGYGGKSRSGASRPENIRNKILQTCKEIIEIGIKDPEMISLMSFFEEGVGADTISDLTITVIMEDLIKITVDFCKKNNIKLDKIQIRSLKNQKIELIDYDLPLFEDDKKKYPIVLVPKDIISELFIATDWSSIDRVVMQNNTIRSSVGSYLSNILKANIKERKEAIRKFSLESSQNFQLLLQSIKDNCSYYDENIDALSYYKIKQIFEKDNSNLKRDKSYKIKDAKDIMGIVKDIIDLFKDHVENKIYGKNCGLEINQKKNVHLKYCFMQFLMHFVVQTM